MYVRNCWYVAAWDHDIAPGQLFSINILDEPLVIYRTDDDNFVALEDRCCHRLAPLSLGKVEDGCNLRCMYHGLKFDPTGTCIEVPGQDMIPPTARVRAYPVVARHSWVWVWMGDPSATDPALIPPAIGFDDPEYYLRSGHMDYAADYQLINDNLTDFSHLSFVHSKSFGATEAWARIRPNVRRVPRGIRVSRWLASPEALGGNGQSSSLAKSDESTALWQSYDFLAPGILLMATATYPIEHMPEDRASPPVGTPLSANFTSQAVTPLGEGKSRYFFSWGPRRVDGGPEMADRMYEVALMAFGEDRTIIEAQQRIINQRPGKEVLTSADVGPVQMRAVIRQLIKAERQDGVEQTSGRK